MLIKIFDGELEWGILLICQSGDSDFDLPTDEQVISAVSKNKILVKNKKVAYILTESHVEGETVKVFIGSKEKKPESKSSFSEKLRLHTSTSHMYIGDIPRTQFTVLEFSSTKEPVLNIDGYDNDHGIEIYISSKDKFSQKK